MDFHELLKKYIRHVHTEEGTTFVSHIRRPGDVGFGDEAWGVVFTDEERAELDALEDEVLEID